MLNFRSWPSRVVVAGTGEDTATYIGYSPMAKAMLAHPVWIVEKVDATGANSFAETCLAPGEEEPQPCAVMGAPAELTYRARA